MANIPSQPEVMVNPLGYAATANVIPDETVEASGNASIKSLFPPITEMPIAAGGIPPKRADMNGVFKLIGRHLHWTQNGGVYGFSNQLNYIPGNVIMFGNKLYKCIQACGVDSTVVTPPNAAYWTAYEDIGLNAEANAKAYTDTKCAETLDDAKSYADITATEAVVESKVYIDEHDAATLASATSHSDANLEVARAFAENKLAEAKEYTDQGVQSAKDYVDGKAEDIIDRAKEYVDEADATVLAEAKAYTDTKSSAAVNTAKTYTDTQGVANLEVAAEYTDQQDAITLQDSKSYADTRDQVILEEAKKYADEHGGAQGDFLPLDCSEPLTGSALVVPTAFKITPSGSLAGMSLTASGAVYGSPNSLNKLEFNDATTQLWGGKDTSYLKITGSQAELRGGATARRLELSSTNTLLTANDTTSNYLKMVNGGVTQLVGPSANRYLIMDGTHAQLQYNNNNSFISLSNNSAVIGINNTGTQSTITVNSNGVVVLGNDANTFAKISDTITLQYKNGNHGLFLFTDPSSALPRVVLRTTANSSILMHGDSYFTLTCKNTKLAIDDAGKTVYATIDSTPVIQVKIDGSNSTAKFGIDNYRQLLFNVDNSFKVVTGNSSGVCELKLTATSATLTTQNAANLTVNNTKTVLDATQNYKLELVRGSSSNLYGGEVTTRVAVTPTTVSGITSGATKFSITGGLGSGSVRLTNNSYNYIDISNNMVKLYTANDRYFSLETDYLRASLSNASGGRYDALVCSSANAQLKAGNGAYVYLTSAGDTKLLRDANNYLNFGSSYNDLYSDKQLRFQVKNSTITSYRAFSIDAEQGPKWRGYGFSPCITGPTYTVSAEYDIFFGYFYCRGTDKDGSTTVRMCLPYNVNTIDYSWAITENTWGQFNLYKMDGTNIGYIKTTADDFPIGLQNKNGKLWWYGSIKKGLTNGASYEGYAYVHITWITLTGTKM